MELLGRVLVALGISLALTALLLVLYQDDGQATQPEPTAITQAVNPGTIQPASAAATP